MSNSKDFKLTLKTEDAKKYVLQDGKVDFDILIPMPEDLKIEDRNSKGIDIRYYLTNRDRLNIEALPTGEKALISTYWTPICDETYYEPVEAELNKRYDRGKQYVENWRKYGHVTWLTWMPANWGIGRYPETYEVTEHDGITCIYFCAEDEPYPWLHALAENAEFTICEINAEKTQHDYL